MYHMLDCSLAWSVGQLLAWIGRLRDRSVVAFLAHDPSIARLMHYLLHCLIREVLGRWLHWCSQLIIGTLHRSIDQLGEWLVGRSIDVVMNMPTIYLSNCLVTRSLVSWTIDCTIVWLVFWLTYGRIEIVFDIDWFSLRSFELSYAQSSKSGELSLGFSRCSIQRPQSMFCICRLQPVFVRQAPNSCAVSFITNHIVPGLQSLLVRFGLGNSIWAERKSILACICGTRVISSVSLSVSPK